MTNLTLNLINSPSFFSCVNHLYDYNSQNITINSSKPYVVDLCSGEYVVNLFYQNLLAILEKDTLYSIEATLIVIINPEWDDEDEVQKEYVIDKDLLVTSQLPISNLRRWIGHLVYEFDPKYFNDTEDRYKLYV